MSTKFTPGPWDIQDEFIFGGDSRVAVVACHPEDGTSDEEVEANSRLIAAAPDLYEALDLLLNAPASGVVDHYAIEDLARKALAKARGEA